MARSRSRDDDEDDDDYEERPKKRRSRDDEDERDSGGSNTGLIIAGSVIGGVVLIGGIIAAVAFSSSKKKADDEPAVANNNAPAPGPGIGPGMFVPPRTAPPTSKPKGDEPPKLGPGVVPLPASNITLTGAAMTGADGHVAVQSFGQKGRGNAIDVVQTATGKIVGQVQDDQPFDDLITISRDGRFLAVLVSDPFEGNTISVYTVADGKLQKTFRPYPKKDDFNAPSLIWIAFTHHADELLTIHDGGGADTWSMPNFQHGSSVKPQQNLPAGARLQVNGFTKSPANFAISPDRELMAIFNGTGFTIYSTRCAPECKTPDFAGGLAAPLFSGTAFSPDGKRLVSYYQAFGKDVKTCLRVWDAVKGTTDDEGFITVNQAPAGFAFWGPKHIVFHQGGVSTVRVIDLETRREVGKVRCTVPGKFITVPPDGNLWAVVSDGRVSQEPNTSWLAKAAPPASLSAGSEWELSARGLENKVKAP